MASTVAVPGEDVSCALALVNTRHMRGGEPADLIGDAAQAADWLASRGLLSRGARLTGEQDAARLRALRETIRALLAARAGGGPPGADDIALLNATLAAAPLIPALTWDTDGPHRGEQFLAIRPGTGPFGIALARLAADALSLLTRPGGPEPAPCRAHGCIRWFLRTHAARQWCSTRCGDRVRAARHYARHRIS